MSKMLQYFQEDVEMKDRFIKRALGTQRKIEDFGDFKDALYDGFSEGHGENASKQFDDEDIKFLFEDDKVKKEVASNIGEEEAEKLYSDVDKTGSNLFRANPVGEKVSKRQVIAIVIEKPVKSKGYIRRGKTITPYFRSNKKWSPAQIRFISVRKANGLKPKRIAYEYSQHFPKEEQRSESSITSKSYRI
jgi:hypothetical protein